MKMPWYSVFPFFIFCLEPTVTEQLDENNFRHYFCIFFQKYHSETICSQLCSKFFRNNYKPFWQRHLKRYITVVEDFTDMHHHMNQFFLEWISLNDNWWRCLKNYHLHNNPSLLFEEHCTETFHLLLLHASFSLK